MASLIFIVTVLIVFGAACIIVIMRDAARRDRQAAFWVPEKHTVFYATYIEVNCYTPRGLLLDSIVIDVFPHDDPTTASDNHWETACAMARAKARLLNSAWTSGSDNTSPLRHAPPLRRGDGESERGR